MLVGAQTWGRKFVDWEIDATLEKDHALIGVQLPTLIPGPNGFVTVPDRLNDNIHSGYAIWTNWNYITSSLHNLNNMIADAKSRPKALIRIRVHVNCATPETPTAALFRLLLPHQLPGANFRPTKRTGNMVKMTSKSVGY